VAGEAGGHPGLKKAWFVEAAACGAEWGEWVYEVCCI
jgi:hypothetical protein